jgi:hypothetical protein
VRSHGLGTPDLKIEVDISIKATWSLALIHLSALTLSLVPAWERDMISLRTTFKDGEGHILGSIVEVDSVIVWYQTLLILISPFAWPSCVAEAVIADLSKATLLEAQKRGYFAP